MGVREYRRREEKIREKKRDGGERREEKNEKGDTMDGRRRERGELKKNLIFLSFFNCK